MELKVCSQSSKRRSMELKVCSQSSKRRRVVDTDFLGAEELGRKSLMACADGRPVGIERLRGKFVGLLFLRLSKCRPEFLRILKDVQDQIRQKNGDVFEIVWLAVEPDPCSGEKVDARNMFDDYASLTRPWFAIPFDDFLWREHLLCNKYQYRSLYPRLALSDRKGGLFHKDVFHRLVRNYGPALYPFSDARLEKFVKKDEAVLRSKSLKALLGDFVISNGGRTRVPISHLEGKIIGLYLFDGWEFLNSSEFKENFREKLMDIYLQLKRQGKSFEIVFVNVDHDQGYQDEASFLKNLLKMPDWYALPFKDDKIWALHRMFRAEESYCPSLTTVGADPDNFFDIHGANVIQEYGIQAYPFTFEAAINVEIQRLSQLNLAHVFKVLGIDYLLQKGGKGKHTKIKKRPAFCFKKNLLLQKVVNGKHAKTKKRPVSCLLENKDMKVLLYIARKRDVQYHKLLVDLYRKARGSFQVVFCSLEDELALFSTLPKSWLALPFGKLLKYCNYLGNRDNPDQTMKLMLRCHTGPHLIAFAGPSCNFLKMGKVCYGVDAFPFITHQTFIDHLRMWLPLQLGWGLQKPISDRGWE